jgi:hypothetical protein
MVQIGTYTELLSSSTSFARLLEDIHQHQQEQEQQSLFLARQVSRMDSFSPGIEQEEDAKSLQTNIETKQEGTVKWSVYMAYLRAGVGVILGLFLIIIIFSAQQAIALCSNWWLAEWSSDESHRHDIPKNCTNIIDQKTSRIHLMNDTEWKEHRNQRFYTFCCRLINNIFFSNISYLFVGIVAVLFLITLIRVVTTEFIFLNAGRVLHNK